MARRKGSKDKKKRAIRNALIGAAGIGVLGGAAFLGRKKIASMIPGKPRKVMGKGYKADTADAFTKHQYGMFDFEDPMKSGVGGYKGLSKEERKKLIKRRKAMVQRELDLNLRSELDKVATSPRKRRASSDALGKFRIKQRVVGRMKENALLRGDRTKAVQNAVRKYGAKY